MPQRELVPHLAVRQIIEAAARLQQQPAPFGARYATPQDRRISPGAAPGEMTTSPTTGTISNPNSQADAVPGHGPVNHKLRIKAGGGVGYYSRLVWCCSQRDSLSCFYDGDRGHDAFRSPIRSQKEEAMSSVSGAAGHAALAICESMLLSLTENKIIDGAEAKAILADAAAAHRNSISLLSDGTAP